MKLGIYNTVIDIYVVIRSRKPDLLLPKVML